MKSGGVAIACGPDGSEAIPIPAYCPSRECREARDEAAIQRLVERGVIDP